MKNSNRVTIYSKNGNSVEVIGSMVPSFLKKGYRKTKPKDSKNEIKREQ